jgi:hypothetical protein
MARKPEGEEVPHGGELTAVNISGSAHAPFVYFEEAATFGHVNGIIQVTLEAVRLYPDPPAVKRERVVVAHLRMNIPAAKALQRAIEGALLLAAPADTAKN